MSNGTLTITSCTLCSNIGFVNKYGLFFNHLTVFSMSSKLYANAVYAELRRWLIQSQKLRRSASLAYGKIKANLATLEPIATKDEMDKLQDEAGEFRFHF